MKVIMFSNVETVDNLILANSETDIIQNLYLLLFLSKVASLYCRNIILTAK